MAERERLEGEILWGRTDNPLDRCLGLEKLLDALWNAWFRQSIAEDAFVRAEHLLKAS